MLHGSELQGGVHLRPWDRKLGPCQTQPDPGQGGQVHGDQLWWHPPDYNREDHCANTVNSARRSCYRQWLAGTSGSGLEAGGELEAGGQLLVTVAAVPTAILATEEPL